MRKKRLNSVALVSAPWPLYNRPSIQLAALKAYLQNRHPDLEIAAYHIYLKVAVSIGYNIYQEISERTWLAESVYAALLYPERRDLIEDVFFSNAKARSGLRSIDFGNLSKKVAKTTNRFIDEINWKGFGLAGFTICLCQLTATLYFIDRIKKKCPELPVVVGGSMFAGEGVANLLETVPQIDFVVNGEGELPLSRLVGYLRKSSRTLEVQSIPGVIMRQSGRGNTPVTRSQLDDLSGLPLPDYGDYFKLLQTLEEENTFFPTLPAEISRGCWWQRSAAGKNYSGCAFCNLNLQWKGYRTKKAEQVVSDVEQLTSRYRTLSVAFMDNLIPLKESEAIFEQLSGLDKDLRLFCEIRAVTSRQLLGKMKSAGVNKLQIGIEALSTRLLGKLNKGTKTIQNLEVMKNCEELGLVNASNLIMQFPGSDDDDVAETLRNLEFALPFRPMRVVQFWLGTGSPVWKDPQAFGIQTVFNHPNWSRLFPVDVIKRMDFMIKSYRGDRLLQKKLWQPVKAKVRSWEKRYIELHRNPFSQPILSYLDGKDFLIIYQRRLQAETMTHRLVGASREIYLFCQQRRDMKSIMDRFPLFGEDRLVPFLKMMVGKKLMFEENHEYLSLAVSVRPRSGSTD